MLISVVIPIFNEEDALPGFHQELIATLRSLPHDYEVWYVAGGSTDRTSDLVREWHAADTRVRLLELSRNYGHQAALTAGLDYARGEVTVTMDGDGQHPPALIPHLIAAYEAGYDVVLTQRRSLGGVPAPSRLFSRLFYHTINRLSNSQIVPDSADFRLLARPVVQDLREMREQHRFIRGMVSWLGYRQTVVPFDAPPRLAGRSKYSFRKRLRLALDAIFSFSIVPIQLIIAAGLLLLTVAVLQAIYVLAAFITQGRNSFPPGWVSLMLAILSIGGMQLVMLGIVGYYIGLSFQEVKRRPVYFVNKRLSTLDDEPAEARPDSA
jgi:glycosyltransferase involved in cell wall biosynthesis